MSAVNKLERLVRHDILLRVACAVLCYAYLDTSVKTHIDTIAPGKYKAAAMMQLTKVMRTAYHAR